MKGIAAILLCLATSFAQAQVYVSQSGAGAQNGSDAADAYPLGWLGTAGNWGAGPGQVGPGVTVHLVGTITSGFSILGGGSSGNPVTIYFEPGANMTAPVWSDPTLGYSAINGGNFSYITINGGSNGIIQATQCGDGLSNPYGCNGILFAAGGGITVENLTIQNLFVRTRWSTNEIANGDGIIFAPVNNSSILVTNCIFHDMTVGVGISFGGIVSNITIAGCTAYNVNWGGNAGDTGGGSVLNGLNLVGNHIYNWANWDDPADLYHHNGFYGWLVNGGTMTNVVVSGNTIGPGFGSDNTSGLFFSGPISSVLVYNNVFLATDGTSPANGMLTIGLGGNYTTPNTAQIFNNTFMGAGTGTAISFSGGLGASLTTYACTNNLFDNVGVAVFETYHSKSTTLCDNNIYYNVPLTGQLTGFSLSNDGNANFVTFATWQGWSMDTHSTNNRNPNLNNFIPLNPSSTIEVGANLSAFFTNDFYGNPRTNGWDIGACQHYGTNPPPTAPSNLHIVLNSTTLRQNGLNAACGPVDTTNLAAWWPLDDLSGFDASGNGNTLTFGSAPSPLTGMVTNALQFNGAQSVSVGGIAVGTTHTCTAWVMPSNQDGPYNFGGILDGGSDNLNPLSVSGSPASSFGYTSASSGVNFGTNFISGTWYFIASVRVDSSVTLYLNGAQVATGSLSDDVPVTVDGIGARLAGPFYYNGGLDDVRVYSRALSAGEISTIYSHGLSACP